MDIAHFARLAAYNRWMNDKVFDAAQALGEDAAHEAMGAFFGSILGTLNHLAVADTVWLQRLARHPAAFASLAPVRSLPTPSALNQMLFDSLATLRPYRQLLDETLIGFCEELKGEQLDAPFDYQSMKGQPYRKRLSDVLLHVFNHQTHHRGQVTTLLMQRGVDPGATDLILMVPEWG
ncbi:Uncharacterized damage-inducible protein DinB (forms a four-helix bundle) [Solimonas aquatica]|uniref:Uncharacterized damage-inducible protein DinB (Forms a four-helix bundle) n=1 Tax=Solimonas aquatica TaxID=489703 RepID=A0A1H8ZYW1_9GAMM|nr:DinB family protein [Solimonas aquatica]SEP69441.1 Uncharacterized damage-inducible protein DinB (forms a four-helix bundle) [Solimonas aquatica]